MQRGRPGLPPRRCACGSVTRSRSASRCSSCIAKAKLESHELNAAAATAGVAVGTIRRRLAHGMTLGQAITYQRPDRKRERTHEYHGADRYEVIAKFAEKQGGRCAACGALEDLLFLDHCHTTGKPRALLCHHCNAALGLLAEDPERCARLERYAKRCQRIRGDV